MGKDLIGTPSKEDLKIAQGQLKLAQVDNELLKRENENLKTLVSNLQEVSEVDKNNIKVMSQPLMSMGGSLVENLFEIDDRGAMKLTEMGQNFTQALKDYSKEIEDPDPTPKVSYKEKLANFRNKVFNKTEEVTTETKQVLNRAKNLASSKVKTAINKLGSAVDKSYSTVVDSTNSLIKGAKEVGDKTVQAANTTIDAAGTGKAYVGGIAKAGTKEISSYLSKQNDKVVGFAKEQKLNVTSKVSEAKKFLDTQMTRYEQKAMKDSEFQPKKDSSVLARASALGTHKVKDSISKNFEKVKESTQAGMKMIADTGKNLLNKISKTLGKAHSAGMDNVEKRNEKKAQKNQDFEM